MSEQITNFNEVVKNNFSILDLFTKAITRAHGESHPIAFEVRDLFEQINVKVKGAGTDKPNLDKEFIQLRNVTDNYSVPKGVCRTYAGTYDMLLEVDKAYHA